MHKRHRETEQTKILNSSSDEATESHERNKLYVPRKYIRLRRSESAPVHISDTSSDEGNDLDQMEQENRQLVSNLKRYSSDPKTLLLPPQKKFQPLALSLSAKSPSPRKSSDLLNIPMSVPKVSPATCRDAWHSFRSTLTALKRNCQPTVLKYSKNEESMNNTVLEHSFATSLEGNLETMVNTQRTPNSVQKMSTGSNKKRCIKGGYVHEYKRQMLRERMDRRSLAHNQRLGISSGQRVRVLSTSESFGVSKARVQVVTEDDENKAIFHIIIAPTMASSICVGSNLDLYFDLKVDYGLQLPNKELVYVQPNKIVLL